MPTTANADHRQLRRLLTLARDLLQASDVEGIFKLVGPVIRETLRADGSMLLTAFNGTEHVIEYDCLGLIQQSFKETALYECSRRIINGITPIILPEQSGQPEDGLRHLLTLGINRLLVVSSPTPDPLITLSAYWHESNTTLRLEKSETVLRLISELVAAALGTLATKVELSDKLSNSRILMEKMTSDHKKTVHTYMQSEREAQRISITDVLTGAKNRRGFFLQGEHVFQLSRRNKQSSSLIFIDIDGLKNVNDKLGHDAGDDLIREVARLLKLCFRSSDVLARLGGDEFAAYTLETTEPSIILQRIQAAVQKANTAALPFQVALSIGIVQCDPLVCTSFEEYLMQADKLMYESKRGKRLGRL